MGKPITTIVREACGELGLKATLVRSKRHHVYEFKHVESGVQFRAALPGSPGKGRAEANCRAMLRRLLKSRTGGA